LPRKTSANDPADWLSYFVTRYPGFDLDDPDWPALRQQVEDVGKLLDRVKALVTPPPKN